MAAPLSVKGIFKCRPVLVSLAILQVWVKVINKVIVRVVQPIVKKAWTVIHAFLWWRHHTFALISLGATLKPDIQMHDESLRNSMPCNGNFNYLVFVRQIAKHSHINTYLHLRVL